MTHPGRTAEPVTREFLTVPETCEALSIGRRHVYRLVTAGELRIVKIGACARIPCDDVRAFAGRLMQRSGADPAA